MDEYRICLICSASLSSVHLGMDICRACATFFKRSKLTGKEYPCRQANGQCDVSIGTKIKCRSCRFNKCLAVGIVYEGPMRARVKPVTPLLERIEKEYSALINRRRMKELELMRSCQDKLLTSHAEEEQIFKDYIAKLSIVIRYYMTRQLWGDVRTKLMCSVVTCYDTEIPMDFYYPEGKGNMDFFERSQITETEFHSLVALVLTEHDLSISEEAERIIDKIRQEIFENLQTYYQNELGLVDFSMRLGNLMSLNHTIQECHSLFKVAMRFFSSVFDLHMTEKSMEAMMI